MFALRGLDTKQKISVLQDCRHGLISELLSYLEEERYHCRAAKQGIKTFAPPDFDSIMLFEKIEYLENEIARLTRKARKNIKKG